jgi:hypothetical protein
MRAGLSFSHSPISLLLRQPLSIKKSYAGAIQLLFSTEYKQEVSEFFAPYVGSARFTEGVTEIIQPSKYRIILCEF